jgi:hypothetical protein
MIGWMPIPRQKDREFLALEQCEVPFYNRDNLISSFHPQGAPGQEVILDIGDEQRIAWLQSFHAGLLCMHNKGPSAYPVDSADPKGLAFGSQQPLTTYKPLCGAELTG